MRVDRRWVLVLGAVAAAAVAAFYWDLFGLTAAIRNWLLVATPVEGPAPAMLDAVLERQWRVRQFRALLDREPLLSVAVFSTALGAGLVGGAVGAFYYQQRLIRRGGWR